MSESIAEAPAEAVLPLVPSPGALGAICQSAELTLVFLFASHGPRLLTSK